MKFHWKRLESGTRNPESMEWDPESKTVLCSLTWGDSTGLWMANYYFSFINLPLIRRPHLKTFVNETSVTRFLPFTDCFLLFRVVSFCFHAPRDSLESIVYRSQLIKKLAHANNINNNINSESCNISESHKKIKCESSRGVSQLIKVHECQDTITSHHEICHPSKSLAVSLSLSHTQIGLP